MDELYIVWMGLTWPHLIIIKLIQKAVVITQCIIFQNKHFNNQSFSRQQQNNQYNQQQNYSNSK